jgi:hypothetical protein
VGCEGRLVLATQEGGGVGGQSTQNDVRSVDNVPLTLDLTRLRAVRTHRITLSRRRSGGARWSQRARTTSVPEGHARSCRTTAGNDTRLRGARSKRAAVPHRRLTSPTEPPNVSAYRIGCRLRHADGGTTSFGGPARRPPSGRRHHLHFRERVITPRMREWLLAGSKQTRPKAEIAHRHASDMTEGVPPTTTQPGLRPGSAVGTAVHRPPPGLRTDLAVTAEPARRLGDGARSVRGSRVGGDELRRASAGGTAENAGVTWERVDAEDGVLRPCPSVDRPGAPRLFTPPPFTGTAHRRPPGRRPGPVARPGVVAGGGIHRGCRAR